MCCLLAGFHCNYCSHQLGHERVGWTNDYGNMCTPYSTYIVTMTSTAATVCMYVIPNWECGQELCRWHGQPRRFYTFFCMLQVGNAPLAQTNYIFDKSMDALRVVFNVLDCSQSFAFLGYERAWRSQFSHFFAYNANNSVSLGLKCFACPLSVLY